MTKEEFTHWMRVTQNSKHQWTLDPIRQANNEELLIFKGGVDGIFVLIDAHGKAIGGAYEGAIPHIGEAILHRQHERTFASQGAAFESLAVTLGAPFLADLVRGN